MLVFLPDGIVGRPMAVEADWAVSITRRGPLRRRDRPDRIRDLRQHAAALQLALQEEIDMRHGDGMGTRIAHPAMAAVGFLVEQHAMALSFASAPPSCGHGRDGRGRPRSR